MIERPTCDEKVIYIEQYLWYEFFLSRFFFFNLVSEFSLTECVLKKTFGNYCWSGYNPIVSVVAIWSIPQ